VIAGPLFGVGVRVVSVTTQRTKKQEPTDVDVIGKFCTRWRVDILRCCVRNRATWAATAPKRAGSHKDGCLKIHMQPLSLPHESCSKKGLA
jgi:hypothetical protein